MPDYWEDSQFADLALLIAANHMHRSRRCLPSSVECQCASGMPVPLNRLQDAGVQGFDRTSLLEQAKRQPHLACLRRLTMQSTGVLSTFLSLWATDTHVALSTIIAASHFTLTVTGLPTQSSRFDNNCGTVPSAPWLALWRNLKPFHLIVTAR